MNLLTRKEACQYLGGISESTFDRLVREREIAHVRIRRRVIRFRPSDLDRYLFTGLVEPRQRPADGEGDAA